MPTRRRVWVRRLAPALVYGLGQLFTLAVVALVGSVHHKTLRTLLTGWDGKLLLQIASSGYAPAVRGGVMQGSGGSIAFFPGYPVAVRWLDRVLPGHVVPAAFTVSVAAGIATAYALVRLARHLRGGGRRTGLLWVALVGSGPLAVVLSMTYTESLFCAVAAWGLVAVLERRWVWAGLAALTAGLLRPTGLALIVTVMVTALAYAIAHRRSGPQVRALVGAGLAPLGLAGWFGWIALRYGGVGAYFRVQETGWNSHFDWGRATAAFLWRTFTGGTEPVDLAVVGVLAGSLGLAFLLLRQQRQPALVLYALLVMAMDIGSAGILNSKVRLMIPAFPLLIPVAVWLGRQSAPVRVLALVAVAVVGAWYSAYSLAVYPHAI